MKCFPVNAIKKAMFLYFFDSSFVAESLGRVALQELLEEKTRIWVHLAFINTGGWQLNLHIEDVHKNFFRGVTVKWQVPRQEFVSHDS